MTIIDTESGKSVASHRGQSNQPFHFTVSSPKLWSPDTPNLYNVTVTLGKDKIQSYTGFRTVSKGTVDGVVRPLLNGEFVFWFGTLDQGFWPDGIYTPPNREAMVYDLHMLKKLGFNMLRKHVRTRCFLFLFGYTELMAQKIKVETALFYRACDELGLMVIQDMPALRPLQNILPNDSQQQEFVRQLELLVNQHKSYPSIVTWVSNRIRNFNGKHHF